MYATTNIKHFVSVLFSTRVRYRRCVVFINLKSIKDKIRGEQGMKEKIIISYFKCDSHQGDELYRKTKHELEQRSIQGMDVEVVLRESDTLVGRDAFMCNDIVIFDASLEGEEVGQQYDALIEPMLYSEYVLIVSRTILPFNVFGTWKGGYPRYLQDRKSTRLNSSHM